MGVLEEVCGCCQKQNDQVPEEPRRKDIEESRVEQAQSDFDMVDEESRDDTEDPDEAQNGEELQALEELAKPRLPSLRVSLEEDKRYNFPGDTAALRTLELAPLDEHNSHEVIGFIPYYPNLSHFILRLNSERNEAIDVTPLLKKHANTLVSIQVFCEGIGSANDILLVEDTLRSLVNAMASLRIRHFLFATRHSQASLPSLFWQLLPSFSELQLIDIDCKRLQGLCGPLCSPSVKILRLVEHYRQDFFRTDRLDLTMMTALEKFVVDAPRSILLAESSPLLTELCLRGVDSIHGDCSQVRVLRISTRADMSLRPSTPLASILEQIGTFRRLRRLELCCPYVLRSASLELCQNVKELKIIETNAHEFEEVLDLSLFKNLQQVRIRTKRIVRLAESNRRLWRLELWNVFAVQGDLSGLSTLNLRGVAKTNRAIAACQASGLLELGVKSSPEPVKISATHLMALHLADLELQQLDSSGGPLEVPFLENVSYSHLSFPIDAKQILLSKFSRQQFDGFKARVVRTSVVGLGFNWVPALRRTASVRVIMDFVDQVKGQLGFFAVSRDLAAVNFPKMPNLKALGLRGPPDMRSYSLSNPVSGHTEIGLLSRWQQAFTPVDKAVSCLDRLTDNSPEQSPQRVGYSIIPSIAAFWNRVRLYETDLCSDWMWTEMLWSDVSPDRQTEDLAKWN